MSDSKPNVIAIDGPSASGKSTVARRIALALGYLYVDSGALYRGITWKTLRRGLNPASEEDVDKILTESRVEFLVKDGAVRYEIDGVDPGAAIRADEVNENVSLVAALPAVRSRVVAWLRDMAQHGGLVMEGRDIGTAVFPDAKCKFYLDASVEERARRRHAENAAAMAQQSINLVGESLQRRDRRDMNRAADPLQVADDAVVIDSTTLDIGQVCEKILKEINAS